MPLATTATNGNGVHHVENGNGILHAENQKKKALYSVEAVPQGCESRTLPFHDSLVEAIGEDVTIDDLSYITVNCNVRSLVESYVLKSSKSTGSVHVNREYPEDDDEGEACVELEMKFTSLSLGLGVHAFEFHGETLWCIKHTVGAPVGTMGGATMFSDTILVARGRDKVELLQLLCEELIAKTERRSPNSYSFFKWDVKRQTWSFMGLHTARSIDSVVLPEGQKRKVVDDMKEFLTSETRSFYHERGIPYKRSYLFHGVPGTGKTSLVQALAGKFRRALCFMQPTHPEFTDEMLKKAVSRTPSNSIIVLEDIDALFTKDRSNRGKSAVTFSGLLNSLDGIGMPKGVIFILTTNFREKLDEALVRNGRVDQHVSFGYITDQQVVAMFRLFFDDEHADAFLKALREKVTGEVLTPAILQHYFIKHRKDTPQDVINNIADILVELEERNQEGAAESEEADKKKEKKKKTPDASSCGSAATRYALHLSVSIPVAISAILCIALRSLRSKP